MSLPKAISGVRKIFEADRRNPIDRATAAKHIGYAGPSGAADKALAALAHYGLTEKTGKGEIRVSQLALDIIHPDPSKPASEKQALLEAGMGPQVFKDLRARFPDHVSEDSLKSYLIREGFQNVAINPLMNAYFDTFRFLEQSKVFESGGWERGSGSDWGREDETEEAKGSTETVFGGAKIGDLIQWESGGALCLEKPMRVRLVTEDGQWVAVEGSETGIPMSEVIVEERAAGTAGPPPVFKMSEASSDARPREGEAEWISNVVGRGRKVRLLVSGGDMGPKEISKLITLLEAQKVVLDDDEEDDARG
jgi:hypothetical protein